jgi:hypothetical protein
MELPLDVVKYMLQSYGSIADLLHVSATCSQYWYAFRRDEAAISLWLKVINRECLEMYKQSKTRSPNTADILNNDSFDYFMDTEPQTEYSFLKLLHTQPVKSFFPAWCCGKLLSVAAVSRMVLVTERSYKKYQSPILYHIFQGIEKGVLSVHQEATLALWCAAFRAPDRVDTLIRRRIFSASVDIPPLAYYCFTSDIPPCPQSLHRWAEAQPEAPIKEDPMFRHCLGLRWACQRGWADVVTFYLHLGANPRALRSAPIRYAASAGHREVLHKLLPQLTPEDIDGLIDRYSNTLTAHKKEALARR